MPKLGRLPHTSQTDAIRTRSSSAKAAWNGQTLPSGPVGTLEALGANDLKAVVCAYRDALRSHQQLINRLNVYPVPDGDTGTNMALTVESVVSELAEADGMGEVCRAVSHGSLMGARGNSGVILSQIMRGLASQFATAPDGAGAQIVTAGLKSASEAAYAAVARPVEGTMLTVMRGAAEGCGGGSLLEVLERARTSANEALARTPELLPVLDHAGVVDAGGAGLCLLFDAMLSVVDSRPLPEPPAGPLPESPAGSLPAATTPPAVAGAPSAPGGLRYEVMYFLDAPDETIAAFRDVWAGIGDSIVVVGGDGLWNCHIHTDDVGAAIEAALDCGRPRDIRVTDLAEQVEEERWVREAGLSTRVPHQHVRTGLIAVATGGGVGRLFHSIGVQAIVAGGQSMNPSTAQILEAVEAAPADAVLVLPNNNNIIPVAEQVDALSTKPVHVVPTRSVTEGLAAAFAYDPEGDPGEVAAAMCVAAEGVTSGEVSRAVRSAMTEIGPVAEGEYLGLDRNGVVAIAATAAEAATGLLERIVTPDHEIVTLLEGEGSSAADTRRITEWMAEHRPGTAVEVHHGGQPLYQYLFSVE